MTKQLCKWLLPALVAAVWIGVALPTCAHDFKQLRVVVNQLDSASVPDRQQREKDMNDILKQCEKHGIYLQVTIEKVNTNQNPTRANGTPIAPGGKVPSDSAADDLDKIGMTGEVKTNGVKVWVATEVRSGPTNEVVNGSTKPNTPGTVIGEQSGANGDAHTWTHELGHALGLAHTNDLPNLMNPKRGQGGALAGNGLTAAQCKDLQKGADKLSPDTKKTKEQTNQPPAKTVSRWFVDTAEGPLVGTPYDLDYAHLVVDYFLLNPSNPAVYVDTFVNASFVPPPLQVRYLVWLDLDNNPMTGNPAGYDAVIVQQLVSPTEGVATLRWLPSGMEQPLGMISAELSSRYATGETNGWEVPAGAVIHCEVPRSMIPSMGAVIRVRFASANEFLEEFEAIGPEEMSTVPPPELVLRLNVIETLPGNVVIVQGEMFTPLTPYRITYDSTIMAEGMTGPAGEINASFVAPDLVPGDYLVDAIDASCRVQIAVLRMLDNQGLKIRAEGPQLVLSFRTHPGPTYIVEYKEDLMVPGGWAELQRTNTTESLVTILDTPPPDRPRYYRWRQE